MIDTSLIDTPRWFFIWTNKRRCVTTICGWHKLDVISQIEHFTRLPWSKIYARGGRIVKINAKTVSS